MYDHSIRSGVNLGAHRHAEIYLGVPLPNVQDRLKASPETGGQRIVDGAGKAVGPRYHRASDAHAPLSPPERWAGKASRRSHSPT
jgi:hypothetical protein